MDVGLGLRSLMEYLCTPPASRAKEDAPCWPLGAVATHLHFDHSSLYCSFHVLLGLFALTLFKLLTFLYLVIVSVCALLDFGI